MTPEEQAAQSPWTILFSMRSTRRVPHDAVTKLDPTTGYSFTDVNAHTWTHYQVTRWEIIQQSLDVCPTCGETALSTVPFGQKYYFQNDAGKLCLTRYGWGPFTKTAPRIIQQDKYAAGLAGWRALTPDEKEAWTHDPEASRRRLNGRCLYMSRFLRGLL